MESLEILDFRSHRTYGTYAYAPETGVDFSISNRELALAVIEKLREMWPGEPYLICHPPGPGAPYGERPYPAWTRYALLEGPPRGGSPFGDTLAVVWFSENPPGISTFDVPVTAQEWLELSR